MTNQKPPFTADIVGSFLRPEYLKQAREAYAKKDITLEKLTEIEDTAIKEVVDKQLQLKLPVVTDGEFRRAYWHLDFLAELSGVDKVQADKWSVAFHGSQPKAATLKIVNKLDFNEHSFLNHFKYLNSLVQDKAVSKLTIPSPSMLHLICCLREENYQPIDIYKDEQQLYEDLTKTYQKAILAFYNAGCRYLQLDDTSWGEFCDLDKRKTYEKRGFNIDDIANQYVKIINDIIAVAPKDMTITLHVCRGNFRSTWFSSGDYEPVADILFSKCFVDGFFLEYDSDRSGDFAPLRFIKNQKVVLGLVTSKNPKLEKPNEIIKRIHEATNYVPLEQLCLSSQCGFASTEEGNNLSENEQWKKIELIQNIANQIWK